MKDTTRHPVFLRPLSKTNDPLVRALAKRDAPKFSMSPPPFRRKMKATQPPQPQPLSFVEHVNSFSLHSEARSGSKERNSNSPTVTPSTGKVEFRVVSHVHVLQPPSSTLSREEVEEQAWSNATQLFEQVKDIEVPPPQVDINGLYILITETGYKWVPKELVDDPDACMQYLHQQLEDGTIGQHIGNAFGQWYLYGNTHVCSQPTLLSIYLMLLALLVGGLVAQFLV